MPGTAVSPGNARTQTLYVVLLYLGVYLDGFVQAIQLRLVLPPLSPLFNLYVGSVAATWTVMDAPPRGLFIPRGWRLFILVFWPFVLPMYLIWSRGLKGIGLCVLHIFAMTVTYSLGFVLAEYLYY